MDRPRRSTANYSRQLASPPRPAATRRGRGRPRGSTRTVPPVALPSEPPRAGFLEAPPPQPIIEVEVEALSPQTSVPSIFENVASAPPSILLSHTRSSTTRRNPLSRSRPATRPRSPTPSPEESPSDSSSEVSEETEISIYSRPQLVASSSRSQSQVAHSHQTPPPPVRRRRTATLQDTSSRFISRVEPLPLLSAPPSYQATPGGLPPPMHQQTQPVPADDPTIADLEHVRRLLCENGDVLTSTAIDNTRRIKAYLIQFNHPMVTSLVQCLENQRANSGDIAAAFNQLQDYIESALNPL